MNMARAQRIFVYLAVAASAASGCMGSPPPTEEQESAVTVRKGIDYAWHTAGHPTSGALTASGYSFVVRYLSYDTTGKNLTKAEADALIAGGIDVVSNWEYAASAALNGYSQGQKDAQNAQSQAAGCGAPGDRPIYFSVDFDATSGQQAAINSYFDGVASVIGLN